MVCLLANRVVAQDPSLPPGWDDWLLQLDENNIAEQTELLIEEIQWQEENLRGKKIDLNRADRQDLLQSGLLHPSEIEALLRHRQIFGKLLAWYELQAIGGFTPERLAFLERHFEVSSGHQKNSWRNSWQDAKHVFMSRSDISWPLGVGYDEQRKMDGRSHYAGSALGQRIQYRQQGLMHKAALSLSKEAGELGFDRLGGHVQLHSNGRLKRLVLGDYHLQWGEGLVANTGFGAMRGTNLDGFHFPGMVLKGASGSQSFGTYRGAIAQIRLNNRWQWVPWIFRMHWSSTQQSLSDGNNYFSSINRSGLHRTPSERMNRNNLMVQGWGSAWYYQNKHGQLIAGMQQWQLEIPPNPLQPIYRSLHPLGSQRWHVSLAHQYHWRRTQWQGEMAWQPTGGMAVVQQWYANLSANFQSRIAYRYFAPSFQSYFGNSLQRSSEVNNEQGWLFNLQYQPNRKWTIAAFSDVYKYPWLRYRVDAPAEGNEQRLLLIWQPNKGKMLQWHTRYEAFERNTQAETWSAPQSFQRYRHSLQYRELIDENWEYTWQWGWNILLAPATVAQHANSLYFRLRYAQKNWRFASQISFFDAEDYDNRFFVTEPDVLYGAGMAQLNGAGQRFVLLVQYKQRHFDLWLRYTRLTQSDRLQLGSGLDQLPGNLRHQLRLQFQWKHR